MVPADPFKIKGPKKYLTMHKYGSISFYMKKETHFSLFDFHRMDCYKRWLEG